MPAARHPWLPLLVLVLWLGLYLPQAVASTTLTIPQHVPSGTAAAVTIAGSQTFAPGHLRIVYRPGSTLEAEERFPVPALSANTPLTVNWTPREPGIARLEYHGAPVASPETPALQAQALVGVTYATLPLSGLLVMLLAGFVLFGGCCFAFRLLRTRPTADGPPSD